MSKPATVSDCMHRKPLTIHAKANIVEAIELIVENKLTGVTVLDDEGVAVGILSEIDCLSSILTAVYNDGDPEHALVCDAMSKVVNTCSPHDNIVEVAQEMLKTCQRRRPVIEDGKLVGQVSTRNILWALMEHSRRKATNPH